jgi:hypothetical protein
MYIYSYLFSLLHVEGLLPPSDNSVAVNNNNNNNNNDFALRAENVYVVLS